MTEKHTINIKTLSLDDELDFKDERFQFYLEKFVYKVSFLLPSDIDETLLLLRGHLAIEFFVNTIFNLKLVRSKKDLTKGLNFSKKLSLINSMDLIESDIFTSINEINKLRNKIAHVFDYRITMSDLDLAVKPLPKKIRDDFKERIDEERWTERELLRSLITTLLLNLVHSAYILDKSFGEDA